MVWIVVTAIFLAWLIGFALHFGGSLIHLLLIIALAIIVYDLLTSRREPM